MSVSSAQETALQKKIRTKQAKLGVIGLGYVGLPLAMEFAKAGYDVVGIDTNEGKLAELAAGRSYVKDVPSSEVQDAIDKGHFRATSDFSVIKELDTINICVPTPLRKTRDPDISYIHAVVMEIQKHQRREQLIVLESTTYPGTTEEVILPLLSESGLEVGRDFYLAFSPERVDPGNPHYQTRNIPKVVGGVTPVCTEHAIALYKASVDTVVPVSSTKVAEMVKLLENTFRSVNIGLVNEIALMSHTLGLNVWEVIDAAATKPFGFMPFYPGPGLGGHCIPIDPFYLSWKAKQFGFEARFIELAGQINGYMPHFVVSRISDVLNEQKKSISGSKVLILGLAYKSNIDDIRESPALDIIGLLNKKGAVLTACDPFLEDPSQVDIGCEVLALTPEVVRAADCVVIVTAHKQFDYEMILKESRVIVDTRNALKGQTSEKIHLL